MGTPPRKFVWKLFESRCFARLSITRTAVYVSQPTSCNLGRRQQEAKGAEKSNAGVFALGFTFSKISKNAAEPSFGAHITFLSKIL